MKIKKLVYAFYGVVLMFGLAGCKQDQYINYSYVPTPDTPTDAVNAETQAQLAQTAKSVNQSLSELSSIQMTVHPHAKLTPPLNARAVGMAQPVSLNWTGPVEDLLNQIAKITRYRVRVLGVRPAIPAIVAINAKDKTVADILRDTMFQVQKKADITVYSTRRIIELKYYRP